MVFDTVLRNGRVAGRDHELVDIGVRDGRIAAIGPRLDAGRRTARAISRWTGAC